METEKRLNTQPFKVCGETEVGSIRRDFDNEADAQEFFSTLPDRTVSLLEASLVANGEVRERVVSRKVLLGL